MMNAKAMILGSSGLELTDEEARFFREQQPFGFILFARNIDSPDQVSALVRAMRECVSRPDAPVLIDQEGGRVQRLRPPHWQNYPTGWLLGEIFEQSSQDGLRAAWLQSRLIGSDLSALGINVDCLPLLDVPVKGAHDVIGDRAYSYDPEIVIEIGKAAADGLLAAGVLPVIKHIPGHGRAFSDSHLELPVVDASHEELSKTDFAPFRALNDQPMAMSAHVVYSALDANAPATTSRHVVETIIREEIGFDGLLMSDDLSMKALSGDFSDRTQSAFAAGCDIMLHCNGDMAEMQAVAAKTPWLADKALARAEAAMNLLGTTLHDASPDNGDIVAMRAEFVELTNRVA